MTATGGTYTLVVAVEETTDIEVGALGIDRFETGWYAYVGSAVGPGGFARVGRHRELASGERDTRHWHIDYLLSDGNVNIETVVTIEEVDAECSVARALCGEPVPAFGCSDCACESHLYFSASRSSLLAAVEDAHREATVR